MTLFCARRVGERIMIGDNICLRILAIRGNRVQLAFSAPAGIPIHRAELLPLNRAMCGPETKGRSEPS